MARFSVAEAATAGFGVIGRKPLAVLAWGLVILVATAAPMYLLLWTMRPDFAMLMQIGQQPGPANDPEMVERLLRMQSGMMLFQLVFWLWATGVKAVICSAVFRAVLEPQESRFAYLRLGAREGWLTLLFLVEYVLAYIACFILALFGVVVVAVVAMGAGEQSKVAAVATAVAIGLAALALFLWLALKLSMAAPMTFVDRQFRLFESWTFTKGRLGKLLGVTVLLVIILIGIEILFGALMLVGVFALGGAMSWLFEPGAVQALLREPPMEIVRKLGPAISVAGVLLVVFSTVITTVFCAPWAASYRALLNEDPARA
ncbi:hypothetical protein [Caulobacter sp. RL271]|jgi:hypothetical protein|uniref:Glycerophosphoryl diester phosphodiesterase membrane domain-containing protein n=1 Tax=Caulobacter segnis TaxID=88688 RepID=A0ABY4ZPY6_9CAUL|nr:hypothetical protein [Caulobacter segnis]USQ94684.1 hypothetical protein MZV50_19180 [Caulobacter segnis]